jgi:hypothetical protein
MTRGRFAFGWGWRGALALAALGAALPSLAPSAARADRYSEAGGCYTLTSVATGQAAPGASQLRMQATDLGSYLLYRTTGDFLAASGGSVVPAAQPSPTDIVPWQDAEEVRQKTSKALAHSVVVLFASDK